MEPEEPDLQPPEARLGCGWAQERTQTKQKKSSVDEYLETFQLHWIFVDFYLAGWSGVRIGFVFSVTSRKQSLLLLVFLFFNFTSGNVEWFYFWSSYLYSQCERGNHALFQDCLDESCLVLIWAIKASHSKKILYVYGHSIFFIFGVVLVQDS